jgi:hypothetical protein
MTKNEALRLALEALETSMYPQQKQLQAITAIKATLEAKDEPDHSDELTIAYMSGLHRGKELEQRTWVGLTDDEIVLIVAECAASHQHTDIHFAKAIEAKLKEKNT